MAPLGDPLATRGPRRDGDRAGHRAQALFVGLSGFFVANALIAEFIGIKIFSLEGSLGLAPWRWRLLGVEGELQFTAGVLLWPLVFLLTDVINDYYGTRGVRRVTVLAAALIAYGFAVLAVAIALEPADWWRGAGEGLGVGDMQVAFAAIYGQGLWIIGGSLTAFLLGQLVDAVLFARIKRRTGDRLIWLRATGSTVVGQLIDSYLVLYIAFVLGPQRWPIDRLVAIGSVNFAYKLLVAVLLIPALYGLHALVARYVGPAQARAMRAAALSSSSDVEP